MYNSHYGFNVITRRTREH